MIAKKVAKKIIAQHEMQSEVPVLEAPSGFENQAAIEKLFPMPIANWSSDAGTLVAYVDFPPRGERCELYATSKGTVFVDREMGEARSTPEVGSTVIGKLNQIFDQSDNIII